MPIFLSLVNIRQITNNYNWSDTPFSLHALLCTHSGPFVIGVIVSSFHVEQNAKGPKLFAKFLEDIKCLTNYSLNHEYEQLLLFQLNKWFC